MREFPIPVVALGPGSQVEEEELQYMSMPKGMETYRPPMLPEPEELAARAGAHGVLRAALNALQIASTGGAPQPVFLTALGADDLALVNQVMGEGEVSARVADVDGRDSVRVQESVFAGLWRVMRLEGGQVVSDSLEAGPVPTALREAALEDVLSSRLPPLPEPLPEGVMNSPMLLTEIEDHWHDWKPGQPPCVVNLTLLPVGVPDISFLDHQLGTGRITILSRGYGNCRITNTRRPNCWRVVYYNSQDAVILNTVEVIDMPEAACAAGDDLAESHERLAEVLQWVEGALLESKADA